MSYQVLARRWRPKSFSELVGQSHVVRALGNALDNDRLHHAYLFTGTRGVGKTTIARILAKSLNCEQGVTAHPCGECSICKEVDEGRFVDLIEVDAASKTGVDDTRELLDTVPYAPVRGRYKVYLIDEVHMFSNNSFNALLKTLEEPPPHVKFLLATTDPQKVPVTVLSRCLQFSLNRLPIEQIQAQLAHILAAEDTQADDEALYLLSRAADGSMRDALSLLDQAIAFGGGEVGRDAVRDMLGVVAADQLPEILLGVHRGEAEQILQRVQLIAQQAPDFTQLLRELLTLLHRISLLQVAPGAWQSSWGERATLQPLVEALSAEDCQLFYQIALMGQRDLPLAPDAQSGFEMVLLRMLAFRPDAAELEGASADAAKWVNRSSVATQPAAPMAVNEPAPLAHPALDRATEISPKTPSKTSVSESFADWHTVLPQLGLNGLAAQLASHCVVKSWDGRTLTLLVNATGSSLAGSMAEQRLLDALNRYVGAKISLSLEAGEADNTPAQRAQNKQAERQAQAETDIAADPLVKGMQETFDAELVANSIRPVNQHSDN